MDIATRQAVERKAEELEEGCWGGVECLFSEVLNNLPDISFDDVVEAFNDWLDKEWRK